VEHTEPRPEEGYEKRDVENAAVFRPALGFFLLVVLTVVLMRWLFGYLAAREASTDRPLSPIARNAPRELPPEPRLQLSPPTDLAAMREEENEALHSYGWVDRESRVVRIPIERAMELVAKRGLPTRGSPPAASEGSPPARAAKPAGAGKR
jgi:hypothetical protein